MKHMVFAIASCLLLGAGATFALAQTQDTDSQNAQPGMELSTAVTGMATVQNVDYQNRTVTLKGQNGKIFTVKVGPEARNFNQIHKGDQVTFRREESLALAIDKPNEPAISGQQQTMTGAPAGQKPSGKIITTTRITATVENIDRQANEITLRGPEGKARTLKVEHAEALDRLKPGDQVVATFTDAFMIDVSNPNR
jgi:hypothetical protein